MTKIEKDLNITSAVHFSDKFLINSYKLTISMIVETENIREQNVAMERLEYFLNEVVCHGIFIDSSETKAIDKYNKAGITVITLPEEPYDQIIGMTLLLKCNAIMEKRLYITDLNIASRLSDHVRFCVLSEVAEGLFDGDYWWNNPSLSTYDLEKGNTNKVVKLFDNEWTELGLTWKDKKVNQNA